MYIEIHTDDRNLLLKLLADHCESAEPVQATLNKRGDLYKLELVQAMEPPTT